MSNKKNSCLIVSNLNSERHAYYCDRGRGKICGQNFSKQSNLEKIIMA